MSNLKHMAVQGGRELIDTLVQLTGLPSSLIEKDLIDILARQGLCPDSVTLDSLREALLAYMGNMEPLLAQSEIDPASQYPIQ